MYPDYNMYNPYNGFNEYNYYRNSETVNMYNEEIITLKLKS